MKKLLTLNIFILCLMLSSYAQDFYWVNNGGDWSDYSNHWATTSGGSTMQTHVPTIGDIVHFDANSFDTADQVVSVDTSFIDCKSMDWTGATNLPEFIGNTGDTLMISQNLSLIDDDEMRFNFAGLIIFKQAVVAQTLSFDPANQRLKANVLIDINAGTLNVNNDLDLKQSRLNIYNGTLNLSNHHLFVRNFNADSVCSNPIAVVNPKLENVDTLYCEGSLHFLDAFDLSNFNATVIFYETFADSNYINFGNHNLNSEFVFQTAKKYFLISDFQTSKSISFSMSGKFYSQNNDVICSELNSYEYIPRTLDFGTSNIHTSNFTINKTNLTLVSSNASLFLSGAERNIFSSNKDDLAFNTVHIENSDTLMWNGFVDANSFIIDAGTKLFLARSSELNFNSLTADGDCGQYIEIREFSACACGTATPILKSSNSITGSYLKVSDVEAQGTFTANNSFDEGGNSGWTFNEPTATSTLYWIGGSGNWNDLNHWSATSGGAGQSCIPSKNTDVVFDDNSFSGNDTVFLNQYGYCASMTWQNLTTNANFYGNGKLYASDNIQLDPMMTMDFSGDINLENSSAVTKTIQTNGVQINAPVFVDGSATWDFTDVAVIDNNLTLVEGEISLSGGSISVNKFLSDNSNSRTLDIANATVNLNGDSTIWDLNSSGLTVSASNSTIKILNSSHNNKVFNGASKTYGNIECFASLVHINGSNSFDTIKAFAGNTIFFEKGTTTTLDSLSANASCNDPVSLICTSYDSPATFKLSGVVAPVLTVDNFFIKNIVGNTSLGKTYVANSSSKIGDVTGWTFNSSPTGKVYHWIGNNSNWHDISNWEINSVPATCLPTISDTVVIDPVEFAVATTHQIDIDKNAYCRTFIATGLNSDFLKVNFSENLYVATSMSLSDSVQFAYVDKPDLTSGNDNNVGVFFIPDTINFIFNPQKAQFDVNLTINASVKSDTVFLESNLDMDTVAAFTVMSGTFDAQKNDMKCGYFYTSSSSDKEINVKYSDILIFMKLDIQDNTILDFYADTSLIEFNGNDINYSVFSGGNQTFYDVKFSGISTDTNINLIVFVTGNNTFHTFSVYKGINMFVKEGSTQQIDSSLILSGTCQNYVHISSMDKGNSYSFNSSQVDTATCVKFSDFSMSPNSLAILSFDVDNNSGWTFDATQAATADYSIPYPVCLDDQITFTNNSTSMYGGQTNLAFEWKMNDTTATVIDFYDTFYAEGDYIISLTATDTITGCDDVFVDTLSLSDHSVMLSSSADDLKICAGDSVTFTASSDVATKFAFYLNNVFLDFGDSTITTYKTDTLKNGDSVRVEAVYKGCVKSSSALKFVVNPVPVTLLSCSDVDTAICDGDAINFTATGADNYSFLLNGSQISGFSETSVYSSSSLTNQDIISVVGKDTVTGCFAQSVNEYTVTVWDNPVISLASAVAPPTICSGDTLRFDASGGNWYEYFINGVSQGAQSAQDYFLTHILQDDDIVTTVGYDVHSCHSQSNGIQVTVNPSPNTELTSSDADTSICEGDDVTLLGSGANEYQFFIDGVSQGAFSPSNSINTSSLQNNQQVTLLGRIGTCTRSADTLVFSVFPSIDMTASSTEICPNENITFTASGDTIYQFFVDGVAATPVQTLATFSTSSLTDGQVVSVKGTAGACLPNDITITVHQTPVISLSCSEADTTICEGDNVTFSATGAYEYQFLIDGVSQTTMSTVSNFSSTSITNGQVVTVSGESSYGCPANSSDAFTVKVNPYPTVSLASDNATNQICAGDTITFSATGADEYQFLISPNYQSGFSNNSVFVTDDVTNGATVSVVGRTDNCAVTASQTFTYTVYNNPSVNLLALTPISVCEFDTITIQAVGATNYEFFVNDVSQGVASSNDILSSNNFNDDDVITVRGFQNICQADGLDTIVVDVNQLPNMNFTSNIVNNSICYGDTAIFTATGAMTYQFLLNNFSYGDTNSTGKLIFPNIEEGQTVGVVGYNHACFDTASNVFTPVVNFIDATLTADSNTVCAGNQLIINAEGGDLYEFLLNGVSQGSASATSSFVVNNPQNDDYVNVIVTDNTTNCSFKSSAFYLNVLDVPHITAMPDVEFCQYDSVTLISNSDINNQWYFNSVLQDEVSNSYVVHQGGEYGLVVASGILGGVYSSGNNAYGQLGDGTNMQTVNVSKAIFPNKMISISSGEDFALGIDENNDVWAWGNNTWGNLGIGNYAPVYTPVKVQSLSNIKDVETGYYHSIALKDDSTLMAWGKNTFGQLGFGNFASANFPIAVTGIQKVKQVAAGQNHTLALTSDGKVYAWGDNSAGQLGIGSFSTKNSPTLISGIDSVVFIATGANSSFAIRNDGSVWCWGANENGQLGLGDLVYRNHPVKNNYLINIEEIKSGLHHTLALNQYGEVLAWGSNSVGQLGFDTDEVDTLLPHKVGINGVKSIDCGQFCSYALKNDLGLWSWGKNNAGQLGDGTSADKNIPVRATNFTSINKISAGSDFVNVIWNNTQTCGAETITITMDSVPDVYIIKNGTTLSTVQGQSYQWYFNGIEIENSNSQSITATADGSYSVEVFFANNCSAFSDEYYFSVNIDALYSVDNVMITPNPNNGNFELIFNMPDYLLDEIVSYKLVSVTGAVVAENDDFKASASQQFNFTNIVPGIYDLLIISSYGNINVKIFVVK